MSYRKASASSLTSLNLTDEAQNLLVIKANASPVLRMKKNFIGVLAKTYLLSIEGYWSTAIIEELYP